MVPPLPLKVVGGSFRELGRQYLSQISSRGYSFTETEERANKDYDGMVCALGELFSGCRMSATLTTSELG